MIVKLYSPLATFARAYPIIHFLSIDAAGENTMLRRVMVMALTSKLLKHPASAQTIFYREDQTRRKRINISNLPHRRTLL